MSDEATLASGYGGAYEAGWQSGREDGRKEERARLLAQVDALWDAWEAKYEIGASSYDEGALAALYQVLVLLREDTPHE